MSNTVGDKLAWVGKNLAVTQNIVTNEALLQLSDRKAVVKAMAQVITDLDKNLAVLPLSLKFQRQDIPAELRKVRASSNSIMQAANDKVCSTKTAINLIKPVAKNLRQVRRLITANLSQRVLADSARAGTFTEHLEAEVEKVIIAADRPKIVLKDLAELGQYATHWEKDLNERIARLDTALKKDAGEEPTNPNMGTFEEAGDPQLYQNDITTNKYGERANENALKTQRALTEAYNQVPKTVKISAAGFALVNSPILAVTKNFVHDTDLRKAGIKFIRIDASFNAGYAPGLSVQTGGNTFYLIFQKQLLLAMPLKTLRDKAAFSQIFPDIRRSLHRSLGDLVIIPFGSGKPVSLKENAAEKVSPYQQLFNDKRFFFGNPQFPGIGFIWMLPQSIFNKISMVHYVQVNLPVAPDMKKELNSEPNINPKDSAKWRQAIENSPLVRDKKAREAELDERLQQAAIVRAQRELITGPLYVQLEEIKKLRKAAEQKSEGLVANLTAAQAELAVQTGQLNTLVKGSAEYKTMLAAMAATKINIQHLEAQIGNIKNDELPALAAKKNKLILDIQKAVDKLIAQRKKEKKNNAKTA